VIDSSQRHQGMRFMRAPHIGLRLCQGIFLVPILCAWSVTASVFAQESKEPKTAVVDSKTELVKSFETREEKVQLLTAAIKNDSKNASLYVARGDAYLLGTSYEHVELAINDYTRAISLDGQNRVAYRQRGYARWNREEPDYAGAFDDFEKALEIAPDDPVTLCCRGQLFFILEKDEAAEADFRKAHSSDPNNEVALNNLGFVAAKEGDFDVAIDYFSRAIAIAPKYAEPYQSRGFTYYRKHEFKKALLDLDKAIELRKDWWSAFMDRGDTKIKLGDLPGALLDYSTALEISEFYAGASGVYARRAEVYRRLGDHLKSQADLESAEKYRDYAP